MKIKAFPSGPFNTNAYVIACADTNQGAIIDPAPDSFFFIKRHLEKNDFTPTSIILTHTHWDHIGDAALLRDHYGLPVYVHEKDVLNLEKPGSDGLPCSIEIEGIKADHFMKEGDQVGIGASFWEVIETPGHSPGSVCLYNDCYQLLMSGDTLFRGSIGNLELPTAEPEKMWASLIKLSKLPPKTKVYPGHGEETVIGNEGWMTRAKELFGK